jgi:hypothetical protein
MSMSKYVCNSICIIEGVAGEWEADAAGNPYEIPLYVGFCGSRGYTNGRSWEYFVEPMDSEKADCQECIDAYALHLLAEVP